MTAYLITETLKERVRYAFNQRGLICPIARLRCEIEHCVDTYTIHVSWGPYVLERSWPEQDMRRLAIEVCTEVADEFADRADKEQNSERWAAPSV